MVLRLLFLSLLKAYGRGDHTGLLKRIWEVQPPSDVKVIQVYYLIGSYDGAVIFDAPDFRAAKAFLTRIAAQGVYRIETMGAIPAEEL